jgi:Poly(ADP-ribose) polymerase catalytic domain
MSFSCVTGLKMLSNNVTPEINEYYLLHGTKGQFVKRIIDGFDFRATTDDLLFGKGVYFAECSTKSDQHTGKK